MFAKIEADNRFLDEPGKLDVVYNIEEGARYRVGRINIKIKGENPHTQITTVLNRLSFKPGNVVDTREFAKSERRLKASQLFKVDPMKGVEPKVAYSPPESEDKDAMAAGQRRTSYYRYSVPGGEAPLPPGEAYLDADVSGELQQPGPAPAYAAAPAGPQPTFQQPAGGPAAAGWSPGFSRYPAAPATTSTWCPDGTTNAAPMAQQGPPQPVSQSFIPVQTRYEPSDGWTQPRPAEQGQSWSPGVNGNNGPYPPQAQNYGAAQPQPAPMYYNPPLASAPYGGATAAPPPAAGAYQPFTSSPPGTAAAGAQRRAGPVCPRRSGG